MRETDEQSPLGAVDLNLLGPLEALLRERHVSRAADRLRMSQPAMSRALAALRGTFDDELLVRAPGGYRLTPRAERLQQELAVALPQLESIFSDQPYDPRSAAQTFRISSSDFILTLMAPMVTRQVRATSPASTLLFEAWSPVIYREAERGAVDVVFTGGSPPAPFRSEAIFDDAYVCVVAADHPLAQAETLTLDEYLAREHAVVSIFDGRQGAVDTRLDALGRPRRAGVVVPYHALAASVVRHTDLIATLPSSFVTQLGLADGCAVLSPPPEIAPVHFVMTWHPRLDDDPAQRWLREMIRSATKRAGLRSAGPVDR